MRPLAHLPTPAEDERQLFEHVRVLWDRRVLLLILAIVGGAAGLAASLLAPRAYEAQLLLGVSQSKIADDEPSASELLGNVRSILTSQAVTRHVVVEHQLDQPPHDLTPSGFLLRAITVERIPETTLIELRVRLREPALAARVANAMAARAIALAQQLTVDEAAQAREGIAALVDETRERLDAVAERLEEAKQEAQVELQEKDVATLLDQRAELRRLNVELAGERAALASVEQELATRDRVETLSRSFDADPALTEATRRAGADNILGLRLTDEEVNPTYDRLDTEVARSRARVTDLEQRRTQLTALQDLDEPSLPLLTRLYASERRIARLETDLEIARDAYVEAATRYEQARVQVASRSAQLLVVDRAEPPPLPVPRYVPRNLVLGALAGVLLAIAYVLASRGVASLRRTSARMS